MKEKFENEKREFESEKLTSCWLSFLPLKKKIEKPNKNDFWKMGIKPVFVNPSIFQNKTKKYNSEQ